MVASDRDYPRTIASPLKPAAIMTAQKVPISTDSKSCRYGIDDLENTYFPGARLEIAGLCYRMLLFLACGRGDSGICGDTGS